MSPIREVLARVYVESLDDVLPLYQRLAGDAPTRRFAFRDVELAWVGPFLLVAGTPAALAPLRNRAATVLVDDLDVVAATIISAGGALLEGPGESPNGSRLIAEHPDGTVFEYLHIVT